MESVKDTINCPSCGKGVDEAAMKCPHCKTALVTCDRCGKLVTVSEYLTEASMCESCWHNKTSLVD